MTADLWLPSQLYLEIDLMSKKEEMGIIVSHKIYTFALYMS